MSDEWRVSNQLITHASSLQLSLHTFKELVDQLLGAHAEEALADGGDLAGDVGVAVVGDDRLPVALLKAEQARAAHVAGASAALDIHAVGLWFCALVQEDLARVGALDRPDADAHRRLVAVLADRLEVLAAGHALGDRLGALERLPDLVA